MRRHLPADFEAATLVGRLALDEGPTPVVVRRGRVFDVSRAAPTTADLLSLADPAGAEGRDLGLLEDMGLEAAWTATRQTPRLLSPLDLQCVKAAGVTFAVSAVERVIEERAGGDAGRAQAIRESLRERVGADLRSVTPGSKASAKLKSVLIADGLWSQYLEVAIGPDAEIFTKAPAMSSVGWGDYVGVRADSAWNNPEPEVVLVCDATGAVRGAALGNDVNLRDLEGRSALLLGKAKDNNAACAVGPFIRLFDEAFGLDDVRAAVVKLEVEGEDNFRLEGASSMSQISRDPLDLVAQTIGANHQYPDGFALFLGTMFAPIEDRDAAGQGFTHKPGDLVRISSERLGVLENKVVTCAEAPPWRFGLSALMRNLAARELI
ncbi:MAG: fumarylacetoacetate hydrolase [Phenylobacterium sp.]|nr:MAG: fumarylacetoacetate hydrolase [Phenylobacterium sp.]